MVLNFYFVRGGVVQYFVKEMVACMEGVRKFVCEALI